VSHPSLLARDRAALVVVDVQEAFRPAVEAFEDTAGRVAVLVRGARELGIPVHVTEQYPKGLGRTVPEVADALGDDADPVEKTVFSACRAEGFDLDGRDQAIVCGIETHVCVSQTVHDLLDQGVQVHVPVDAVSSRTGSDKRVGLDKMERACALPSSVETALLELVGAAGTDEFKAIQGLIK
jgi:nicotinamidase-related amidase